MSYSPYSTPAQEYYDEQYKFISPSPTPSPRGPSSFYYAAPPAQTPQRPATRAHFRGASNGFNEFSSPRPQAFSPRYTSDGHYATAANVSQSRKSFWSSSPRTRRERRTSFSYYRPSTPPYGESDEDGIAYVMPARSKSRRYSHFYDDAGHHTDRYKYAQGYPFPEREREPAREPQAREPYHSPRYDAEATRRPQPQPQPQPGRRLSTSVPQRPATARPDAHLQQKKKPPPQSQPQPQPQPHLTNPKPAPSRQATEADAKKHSIPSGYSLKNWDPTEEPILLLGSVFDANSLGKWIYDWTVYSHGAGTPFAEQAGDLWLLLIQLAGKTRRAENATASIRRPENKEMVEEFIEAGERLADKLRVILRACEEPMLKASKHRRSTQLGKSAGVEFVETLFGRDRELERTEKFMQSVRLWNLRFDANCEEILKAPTA